MNQGCLPQELLNIIVDFAAYDSHESLQALSLASRYFLEQSRQHLFRNLSFAEPLSAPGGGELGRCLGILKCNTSLFRYTRHLRVLSLSPSVLAVEGDLRTILAYLIHLRSLSIYLDSTTKGWLQEGLFGQGLIRLTIDFIAWVPRNVLYTLPHLQELRLDSEAEILDIQPQIDDTRIPWKLKTLEYRPYTSHPPRLMLLTGRNSPVYAELSHLRLLISTQEHQKFVWSTIMPACQRAPLKTLKLTYTSTCETFPSLDHYLSPFAVLKYLSVFLSSAGEALRTVPRRTPNTLSALLSQSVQPALEVLDFSIFCSIPSREDSVAASGDRVLITPGLEWEKVDSLLADKSRFPKLQAFRIHYNVYDTRMNEEFLSTGHTSLSFALRKQTLAVLPRVKESGMIVAVGEADTQREFNRIAEPILHGYRGACTSD